MHGIRVSSKGMSESTPDPGPALVPDGTTLNMVSRAWRQPVPGIPSGDQILAQNTEGTGHIQFST